MERIILILLGKRGAGKTSLARMLVEKHHFHHIEMSKYLNSLKSSTVEREMLLRKFVEKTHREQGNTFLIRRLIDDEIGQDYSHIVITGVRHPAELDVLKGLSGYLVVPVYLIVPVFVRLRRIKARSDRNSIKDFLMEEYYAIKWGDRRLQKKASCLMAEGTLESCFSKLFVFLPILKK